MASILLLEDEVDLRSELAAFLGKRNNTVFEAACLAELPADAAKFDIAILDISLPDGSGFEVASRLRQTSQRMGIIMLTARSASSDVIKGLKDGADHYLTKPFRLLELEAIVHALHRRVGGSWVLDLLKRQLVAPGGDSLELSSKEALLFQLLANQKNQLVSRKLLVEEFGHSWLEFDMRRLDTMICRLRKRWQQENGRTLPLKTEHREGYSFQGLIQLC